MDYATCEWCRKNITEVMVARSVLATEDNNSELLMLCWECVVEWCLRLGVLAYEQKVKQKQ